MIYRKTETSISTALKRHSLNQHLRQWAEDRMHREPSSPSRTHNDSSRAESNYTQTQINGTADNNNRGTNVGPSD